MNTPKNNKKFVLPGSQQRIVRLMVVLIFILSIINSDIYCATKTFTGPGNFGTAAKWNGGTLPAAGDDLKIKNACTIDNNVLTDNVSYGTLTLGTGGSLGSIAWAVGGTNRLKAGNITSTIAGGFINMTNGGTLILTGTWTSTNCTFFSGTGTVEVQSSMTLPSAYTTYNNLKINGSSTTVLVGANTTINSDLTVTSGIFSVGAFNLSVTGTTTVTSNMIFTSTTGTKTFNDFILNGTFSNTSANEPFTVNGDFQNNGTFTNGTARVTFTGAASNTISGSAATTAFGGGITVNKGTSNTNILDVQCVITLLNGGLVLTNGTFKLSSASTITPFIVDITTSPYLIPTTAGFWCNGGTITASATSWSLQGLLRVSAGTVNVGTAANHWLAPRTGATIIVEGGALNAADRISQYNEASTFTMTNGTVTVATVSSVTADRPPFNLDHTGSSFSMSGGTLIIRRTGGSAGQNLGFNNKATLGTGFTGGTLQIGDGSTPASQTIEIETTSPVYNLTVNSANATALVTANPLIVVNNVTIAAGKLNSNSLNISVGGNWDNTSAAADPFVEGTGTVTFNGSVAQTINAASAQESFYNLTIANTNGGISLLNSTDINISNVLDLTSGIITTSSEYVVLSNSAAANLSYTNGFINGNFRRYIASNTSTYLFPIGNGTSAADRHRLSYINNSLTGVSYLDASISNYVQVSPNSDPNLNTTQSGTPISSTLGNIPNETFLWTIIPNASPSGGNFGVQLYVENSSLSGSNDNTFAPIMRTNAASYANFSTYDGSTSIPAMGAAGRIFNSGNGYAQRTGYTSFGQFTIGVFVGTLPIELVSFNAKPDENTVGLSWITASEINNNYFTVEKSQDGISFEPIIKIKGAGNSSTINEYNCVDNYPYKGLSYYRLKQSDFDGRSTFSDIVSVTFREADLETNLYPNPFSNSATITINAQRRINNLTLNVYSSLGEKTKVETHEISENEIKIERNNLSSGLYFYELSENGNILSKGKLKIE